MVGVITVVIFFTTISVLSSVFSSVLRAFGSPALFRGIHLKRAGLSKARNTEEDTEDKTEIVVKKMRTVFKNIRCQTVNIPTFH